MVFDRPLHDWPLDLGNWVSVFDGYSHVPTTANVLGDSVSLVVYEHITSTEPDGIYYAASPADVVSAEFVPAAPFFFPGTP